MRVCVGVPWTNQKFLLAYWNIRLELDCDTGSVRMKVFALHFSHRATTRIKKESSSNRPLYSVYGIMVSCRQRTMKNSFSMCRWHPWWVVIAKTKIECEQKGKDIFLCFFDICVIARRSNHWKSGKIRVKKKPHSSFIETKQSNFISPIRNNLRVCVRVLKPYIYIIATPNNSIRRSLHKTAKNRK